jgi:hypothetical protein
MSIYQICGYCGIPGLESLIDEHIKAIDQHKLALYIIL